MSDIERRIGEFLREEAEGAGVSPGMSERVLRGARTRRMATLCGGAVAVVALVTAGVMAAGAIDSPAAGPGPLRIAPAGSQDTPAPSSAPRVVDGCPLTTPGEGFVPPEPYPSEPPELYDKEWYGDAELWGWLDPDGEVWRDLPDDNGDGKLTEKLFLWSEDHAPEDGLTPIKLEGRQLDGTGSFETESPGGGGYSEDIRRFMIVGLEIPPGCWELKAEYGDAELSYVILVEG